MTQETKDKLEQAAQRKWEEDQATNPTPVNPHAYAYGFYAGAEHVLQNPGEFGLVSASLYELDHNRHLNQMADAFNEKQSLIRQLAKCWGALAELVMLKEMKDKEGLSETYEHRKPLAWKKAKEAL